MSDYIIIGSTALNLIIGEFKTAKDLDLIVRPGYNKEAIYNEFPNVKLDIQVFPDFDKILKLNDGSSVLSLDNLYSLLHSHLFWKNRNGKYKSYMKTYAYLQNNGCVLNYKVIDLFYDYWCKIKSPKDHIVLKRPASEFFNNKINRVMSHDDLHSEIAFYMKPMYTMIRKDGCDVMCDKSKFDALTEYDKDLCVIEEVLVTSIERNISFKSGYVHLITSLSRGWFADYALTRAPTYLELLPENKIDPTIINYIKSVKNLKGLL